MGVLPLQFRPGESVDTLGLSGKEVFEIKGLSDDTAPKSEVTLLAHREDGGTTTFQATARLDTPIEVRTYRHGGILHAVLRKLLEG
jgi:aconitate hydratase